MPRNRASLVIAFAGAIALLPTGDAVAQQEGGRDVVPLRELVVSATRTETEVRDVPVNVSVLTREDLAGSAATTLQDVLAELPGVQFQRNTPSYAAHPSWEAVNLRGIGGTAASRTLVLVDGVPLNDPYFGWVRWSQIPVETIERIEVVRGGGSVMWGGQSLAGVIHVITRTPDRTGISASGEGASLSTFRGDALVAFGGKRASGFIAAERFDTDGYILTREDLRGPVDVPSGSDHLSLRGKFEAELTPALRLVAQGNFFDQDKVNATRLRPNSTRSGSGQIGLRRESGGGSRWSWNLFFTAQTYANAVSSVDDERTSETPALDQFDVPSHGIGTNLQWTSSPLGAHTLGAGIDVLRVTGEAFEDVLFRDGAFQNRRHTGGDQILAGLFLQDRIDIGPRAQVTAGVRLDLWNNSDGFRQISTIADGTVSVDSTFRDRTEVRLSESLGLRVHVTDRWSLRASGYTGLRVPTLNELYKPFRASGGVVTEANGALQPERLLGAEAGVDYGTGLWTARLTGFWARVTDAIFDATIARVEEAQVVSPCGFVPAGGVCRQRDNLGTLRTLGAEAEVEVRPARGWLLAASYEYTPTEIVAAADRPELVGNRAVRTPDHQATFRAGHTDDRTLAAFVTARYLGSRYEDDINVGRIDDSVVFDVRLRRRLRPGLTAFVGVQNLFDVAWEIAHDSDRFVRMGAPRTVSGGLRVRLPARGR